MEAMNLVMGIFTAIGIFAIVAIVLYYISRALKHYKPASMPAFPSYNYLKKVSGRCPSGWVYKGQMNSPSGDTFDVCQNEYNVPVCRDWEGQKNGKAGCYSNSMNKVAVFPTVNNWKEYLNGDVANSYRCNWVNRCGPPSSITSADMDNTNATCDNAPPASWIGLSEKC